MLFDLLLADLGRLDTDGAAASRRGETAFALRNLLQAAPAVRDLAQSQAVRGLVEPILGSGCFAVRGILFDKIPGANWKVIWHRDLSITVREKREIAGWGPWSEKAGVIHVQPIPEILQNMLTVRIHLDTCGFENGPLRVLPGTHTRGRLNPQHITALREQIPETICTSGPGGVLMMRPLLLHASSEASQPSHRRVLHLEFAAGILPSGLEWKEQV